jgi:hypothetical protein
MTLAAGFRLGRYEILAFVGAGGMGARAVSALSHPHVGSLYDVDRQSGIDFIVLEYLEGETLAERL